MRKIYSSGSFLRKRVLFAFSLLMIAVTVFGQRTFVHPGISHKTSDLERMKAMVNAQVEPYYTSFLKLRASELGSYSYVVKGEKGIESLPQSYLDGKFGTDSRAAYLNALMWILTNDERHAEKAVEIFNTYKDIKFVNAEATAGLNASKCYIIIEAAELIKHTYAGWSESDRKAFEDMLVYPGYTTDPDKVPSKANSTFYWNLYLYDSGRHGNQELLPMRACMAMGIFLDNEIMYDRALRYFKGENARKDDLPYESAVYPRVGNGDANEYYISYNRSNTPEYHPNYGFNGVLTNYIWENGQSQELSRDQDHAILGVGICANLAEIAWNQGDDVYSFPYENEEPDYRILKGFEYSARYNVSYKYSFEDQPEPWEPVVGEEFYQRDDRTGRWKSLKISPYYESVSTHGNPNQISRGGFHSDKRPVWEMVLNHYKNRLGLDPEQYKWTQRAFDISHNEYGVEGSGWTTDHLGWGSLTYRRPEYCAGDPVTHIGEEIIFGMNQLPGTILAVNYDYFPGNGNGYTHKDISEGEKSAIYRTDGNVDIRQHTDGVFVVTHMEEGEWINYTVNVPAKGRYEVFVNYLSTAEGGKLEVVFNGEKSTQEVEIPVHEASDFADYSLGYVELEPGVQAMRIHVAGTSKALDLHSVRVEAAMEEKPLIHLDGLETNGAIILSWELENIIPENQKVYRGTENSFDKATLLIENLESRIYIDEEIESGVTYYYWLVCERGGESYSSDALIMESSVGYINDEFINSGSLAWEVVTENAKGSIQNNQFYVEMTQVNNGKYRGDIRRIDGATIHAGYYPILAIKMTRPKVVNVTFDTNRGTFGGGANKYTGALAAEDGSDDAHILYYDLLGGELHHTDGNTQIPAETPTTFTTFQFKVADVPAESEQKTYYVDWIKTFTSVEALMEYATGYGEYNSIGTYSVSGQDINYLLTDGILYLSNLPENASIEVYDLSGAPVFRTKAHNDNLSVKLDNTGVYIVRVNHSVIKIVNI